MAKEVLGFIGLGAMGTGMAANLHTKVSELDGGASSPHFHVYNRTRSKAEAFAQQHGGTLVDSSPADLAAQCSVVCLMLMDDEGCLEVIQTICSGGGTAEPQSAADPGGETGAGTASSSCTSSRLQGKVIINHSTTTPSLAQRAAAEVARHGGTYLTAPVFGRPDAAAAARLLVLVAGPDEAQAQVKPYLEAHGRLVQLGSDPSQASALKLTGNFMLFSIVETLAEAFTLGDKNGVPREALLAVVDHFFPAPSIQGYARRMAREETDASSGATVELALKDLRYVRQLAEASRAPVPMADVGFNHLLSAVANGHGRMDVGALLLVLQQQAGCKSGEHCLDSDEK